MSLPKAISDFMSAHGVDADEIWEVRNGAYAIKHKALERVAAQRGIEFQYHEVFVDVADLEKKLCMVRVAGRMGERTEWATGEAAPYNNKNAYPAAMAEKRAKDRVILKLLNTHGTIYSEAEADEFLDPDQSEKGTLLRSSQYAREECKKLQREIAKSSSIEHLEEWARAYKEQIRANPFKDRLRQDYVDKLEELRAKGAA